VIIEFAEYSWSGALDGSTWKLGTPTSETVDASSLSALIGVHIGSRVIYTIPKQSSGGPYAVVIDVVAELKDPAAVS
jgi:hypothetical protein